MRNSDENVCFEPFTHSFGFQAVRERVPTRVDHTSEILSYGKDNLYPQRVEQIVFRSGLTSNAIQVLTSFTNGRGFEDKEFGSSVVNQNPFASEMTKKLTVNDLLRFNSWDYSFFNAFALHFTYNLNFEISGVTPIFSKFCRLGWNDDTKKVDSIKFSKNWERNFSKFNQDRKVESFFLFNPDPAIVEQEINQSGGIDEYPGQIMYASIHDGIYPKVIYDPVLDAVQSNGEIPLYELSNLQNGFHPSIIFKYPGKFENEQERNRVEEQVRTMIGSQNAGGAMVIEVPEEELASFEFLETVSIQNRDRQFEFTSTNVRNTIVQAFGTPPVLLGFHPESGAVTQENMVNSYNVYNEFTRQRRTFISEQYQKWVPFFMDDITPGNDNYSINPMVFVPVQASPVVTPTGQVLETDKQSGDLTIVPGTGNVGSNGTEETQEVKATPVNG